MLQIFEQNPNSNPNPAGEPGPLPEPGAPDLRAEPRLRRGGHRAAACEPRAGALARHVDRLAVRTRQGERHLVGRRSTRRHPVIVSTVRPRARRRRLFKAFTGPGTLEWDVSQLRYNAGSTSGRPGDATRGLTDKVATRQRATRGVGSRSDRRDAGQNRRDAVGGLQTEGLGRVRARRLLAMRIQYAMRWRVERSNDASPELKRGQLRTGQGNVTCRGIVGGGGERAGAHVRAPEPERGPHSQTPEERQGAVLTAVDSLLELR